MTIFVLLLLMSGLIVYSIYEGKKYSETRHDSPIDVKGAFKSKMFLKYITPETLLEGEKIIFTPKTHWLIIIKPIKVFFVLFILSILQKILFSGESFSVYLYYIPGFSSIRGIIPLAIFIAIIYSVLVILDGPWQFLAQKV